MGGRALRLKLGDNLVLIYLLYYQLTGMIIVFGCYLFEPRIRAVVDNGGILSNLLQFVAWSVFWLPLIIIGMISESFKK